jgi:hypothetical protein
LVVPDTLGNFHVFFTQSEHGVCRPVSLLLVEDGHEQIPRHRLSPAALKAFGLLTPVQYEAPYFPSVDPSPPRAEQR